MAVAAVVMTALTTADACRCVSRSVQARAKAADAIVIADVAGFDDRRPTDRTFKVRVVKSWKARLSGPLTILSEATTCQADLRRGTRYLIYLKRTAGGYRTDACAGNLPAAQARAAIAAIGR